MGLHILKWASVFSLLTLSIAQHEHHRVSLFDKAVQHLVRGRNASIKIGVLVKETRSPGNFWLEFDPGVPFTLDDVSINLPFIVTDNPQPVTKFYSNLKYPGCSSMFQPSRNFTTMETFRPHFERNCQSELLPIRLWDGPSSVQDSIIRALGPSIDCINGNGISNRTQTFPSVSLHHVFTSILQLGVHVNSLDIDAQGGDVALLQSVAPFLRNVNDVKIECQTGTFQYETPVLNDCNTARATLVEAGFHVDMEVNNCGVQEYNLYGRRIRH